MLSFPNFPSMVPSKLAILTQRYHRVQESNGDGTLSSGLSVTNAVEHAFCPRFTYFQLVLGIEQREGKRGTVLAGRTFHSRHSTTNKSYKIKRLNGVKSVSYTHLRAHETRHDLVCRL